MVKFYTKSFQGHNKNGQEILQKMFLLRKRNMQMKQLEYFILPLQAMAKFNKISSKRWSGDWKRFTGIGNINWCSHLGNSNR